MSCVSSSYQTKHGLIGVDDLRIRFRSCTRAKVLGQSRTMRILPETERRIACETSFRASPTVHRRPCIADRASSDQILVASNDAASLSSSTQSLGGFTDSNIRLSSHGLSQCATGIASSDSRTRGIWCSEHACTYCAAIGHGGVHRATRTRGDWRLGVRLPLSRASLCGSAVLTSLGVQRNSWC